MHELVLHHYPGSPFSEKVRLVLGHKRLAWRSAQIPVIMPKPDLVALTGGYRRTPVLQCGADVYCDSALIARLLESRAPEPTLFPAQAPLAPLVAQWADSTLFWTVIPYVMQPAGVAHIFQGVGPDVVKAFAADRAQFSAGMRRPNLADARNDLGRYLGWLDAQLGDGRRWLFGDAVSIADFSVAHCAWFIRRAGPTVAEVLDSRPPLADWIDRLLAIGHGSSQPMSGEEAVAAAAAAGAAGAWAATAVEPGLGLDAGTPVTVAATDYGSDPVAGTLVGLTPHEVVVERVDARAGRVRVHFPRHGFRIQKQEPIA